MPIPKPGDGKRTTRDRLITRIGVFLVVIAVGAALGGAVFAVGPYLVGSWPHFTSQLWRKDSRQAMKQRFVIGACVGGFVGLASAWRADRAVNR